MGGRAGQESCGKGEGAWMAWTPVEGTLHLLREIQSRGRWPLPWLKRRSREDGAETGDEASSGVIPSLTEIERPCQRGEDANEEIYRADL